MYIFLTALRQCAFSQVSKGRHVHSSRLNFVKKNIDQLWKCSLKLQLCLGVSCHILNGKKQ